MWELSGQAGAPQSTAGAPAIRCSSPGYGKAGAHDAGVPEVQDAGAPRRPVSKQEYSTPEPPRRSSPELPKRA
eukprot:9791459-Alexandrium_andersonii.AAC.1